MFHDVELGSGDYEGCWGRGGSGPGGVVLDRSCRDVREFVAIERLDVAIIGDV